MYLIGVTLWEGLLEPACIVLMRPSGCDRQGTLRRGTLPPPSPLAAQRTFKEKGRRLEALLGHGGGDVVVRHLLVAGPRRGHHLRGHPAPRLRARVLERCLAESRHAASQCAALAAFAALWRSAAREFFFLSFLRLRVEPRSRTNSSAGRAPLARSASPKPTPGIER